MEPTFTIMGTVCTILPWRLKIILTQIPQFSKDFLVSKNRDNKEQLLNFHNHISNDFMIETNSLQSIVLLDYFKNFIIRERLNQILQKQIMASTMEGLLWGHDRSILALLLLQAIVDCILLSNAPTMIPIQDFIINIHFSNYKNCLIRPKRVSIINFDNSL